MVDVAKGRLDYLDVANIFSTLAVPLDEFLKKGQKE